MSRDKRTQMNKKMTLWTILWSLLNQRILWQVSKIEPCSQEQQSCFWYLFGCWLRFVKEQSAVRKSQLQAPRTEIRKNRKQSKKKIVLGIPWNRKQNSNLLNCFLSSRNTNLHHCSHLNLLALRISSHLQTAEQTNHRLESPSFCKSLL